MIKNLFNIESTIGKYFSYFIISLIIVSLVTFSIETIKGLDGKYYLYLKYIEIGTIIIFTFEYFLRVSLERNKLQFIFSFYGLIDIIAILPFYLSIGLDLRSLRIFRLFRLFRIFKLFKYTKAINKIKKAISAIKEELIIFMVASLFVLYIAAVGIYFFENEAQPDVFSSVFDCLWWAVATLTTVGYGDMFPVTMGGRFFTTIIVFIGLGIIAVPTGLFASSLTNIFNNKTNN